ncbi:hypothetical protein ACTXLQ_12705 [Enterococcus hirae]
MKAIVKEMLTIPTYAKAIKSGEVTLKEAIHQRLKELEMKRLIEEDPLLTPKCEYHDPKHFSRLIAQ